MAEPRDTVRALTGIRADQLPDGEIDGLLDVNAGSVKATAADVLEIHAGTLTAVTSDDISIDGSKQAAVLMARAARLRQQAAEEADDDGFVFDVVGGSPARPELTERQSL